MLTRRLVWVAEEDGRIQGVLVAFAAHGYFYPVRLVGKPNGLWVWGVLHQAFRDALDRGQVYYIVHLGLNPIESKLMHLLRRRGCAVAPGGWFSGYIPQLMRLPVPQPEVQVG